MMKYSLIGIAAAGVAAIPSAAHAEDFVGPRVEATVGWDQVRVDLDRYAATGSKKESDIAWGLGVGYDIALQESLIAGVEGGLTFSDVEHAFAGTTASYALHAKRDLDISGRLGTRLGSNALVYGKLGYTNFRVGTDTDVAGVTTTDNRNLDGLRLGAGIEVALSPRAFLKSEYRYSNYEDGFSRQQIVTSLGLRF